jgi:hypothetical protein
MPLKVQRSSWARAPRTTIAASWRPPFTRNPDLSALDLSRTEIIEVVDKRTFSDGTREVQAIVIANNPACRRSDDRLHRRRATRVCHGGLESRGTASRQAQPGVDISPTKFAGGHGSTADYAPLAALEGK